MENTTTLTLRGRLLKLLSEKISLYDGFARSYALEYIDKENEADKITAKTWKIKADAIQEAYDMCAKILQS